VQQPQGAQQVVIGPSEVHPSRGRLLLVGRPGEPAGCFPFSWDSERTKAIFAASPVGEETRSIRCSRLCGASSPGIGEAGALPVEKSSAAQNRVI
jgi:hypothetical protein